MLHGKNAIRFLAGLMILPGPYACNTEQAPVPAEGLAAWQATADGLVADVAHGEFRKMRLQVFNDEVIRVTATPGQDFSNLPDTMMVVAEPAAGGFTTSQDGEIVHLKTGSMSADVSLATGRVVFRDAAGRPLLSEASRSLSPVTADPGVVDSDSFAIRQQFEQAENEAFYGLGQQQDGRVNYAGQNIELTTHNIEITIPFLVSSAGYGLLWNNASVTRIGDPAPPRPLVEGFDLFDSQGNPGALTVRYFDGDEPLLEAAEPDLNYQFLARAGVREHPLPAAAEQAQDLRIEWQGTIVPRRDGRHEFKMYSSGYARLSLDGEILLDRWRQNWNPWFHNASVDLEAGREYRLALDWTPQGGYLRLLHYAPRPAVETRRLSIASETGKAVDYFVVIGDTADQIISGYRHLTGKATLLPRWAYGFWQSRERYTTQEELLENLEAYRARGIPIDNIVLDWFYWPEDAWGSHAFDPVRFPDPAGMVERVHELDAHIMVSVWPKFYPKTANYAELDAAGCMFNKSIEENNFDWVGPGYLNAFYDAFDPGCRAIYRRQLAEQLNVQGFDAWWLDAVEPDMLSNLSWRHRKDLMSPNALGTGAEYFNAYALPHAETVYRGERETDGQQRSFILTRSGFGGIQRTGAAVWSGDVASRWSNLKEQIAAGIGLGLAGMPYWTFDIGGFTPENHYGWGDQPIGRYSDLPEEWQAPWQELNLRWFQFGAFAPLFRSHGQRPYREIFNLADEGTEVYDSLVWHTKLRYRLMPYIYTLAGDAYHRDGTIMRGLVMDFPDDPAVRDISTQYMFGPAFLVSPVFEADARSREVYLPAGTDWYDFHTGRKLSGGTRTVADAPLARMPLFVRAGSIVPSGPAIQHTGESLNAPLVLNVFTGADGHFEIYEDDGHGYGYEEGQWSRIPVSYDQSEGRLTIGERQGGFDGMAGERTIGIRWISGPETPPGRLDAEPDATLRYTGEPLNIDR
jgi:alpha-D-xyloside xylohydrolase